MPDGGPSSASGDDGSSASKPPRKKPKGLSKILAKRLGTTSRIGLTTEGKIKQELDQYLVIPNWKWRTHLSIGGRWNIPGTLG